MRKREFRVPVYLTFDEKEDLHRKAQAACMDHNQFIRMLIMGYAPRPAPDDRFYQAMDRKGERGRISYSCDGKGSTEENERFAR